MARSLREDEAEIFKDAISAERRFAFDSVSLERLAERRDEEMELTPESAFWFGSHFPRRDQLLIDAARKTKRAR